MGSNLCTTIMYTSNNFVMILVTFAIIISEVHSLSWEEVESGQLPPNALKLYPNTRKPHYFFRLVLESGSLSYGHLTDTSPICTYPEGKKTMTSSKFDALVKGQEILGWEWGSEPSTKSVRCDLEESEGGDFSLDKECIQMAFVRRPLV